MTERVESAQQHDGGPRAMKRRGLIAGAAALMAGIVAVRTSQPVAAVFALQGDFDNAGSGNTNIHSPGSTPAWDTNSSDAVVFSVHNTGTANGVNNIGISVRAANIGISSTVDTPNFNTAIQGAAMGVGGIGVSGDCNASFGVGIEGVSTSYYGVQGITDSGIGVIGKVRSGGVGTSNIGVLGTVGAGPGLPNSQPNTIGVYGQNLSTGANGAGVLGQSDLGSSVGVKGISGAGFPIIGNVIGTGSITNTAAGVLGSGTKGPGVQGQSTTGHGLVGTTNDTSGHAGLIGNATNTGGIGLMGIAPNYGTQTVGHAGEFYGNVKIFGGSLLAPVVQTSVKHQGDGSYRALPGIVAPEGWIEDFGTGTLAADKAEITLDHDFVALVDPNTLHVFLSPEGPLHLYVSQKSAAGFTVIATPIGGAGGPKRADGGGSFSYRVVAKRKDIASERLTKVAPPTAPKIPTAFDIPTSPEIKPPTKQP